jgi:hypothetical protein
MACPQEFLDDHNRSDDEEEDSDYSETDAPVNGNNSDLEEDSTSINNMSTNDLQDEDDDDDEISEPIQVPVRNRKSKKSIGNKNTNNSSNGSSSNNGSSGISGQQQSPSPAQQEEGEIETVSVAFHWTGSLSGLDSKKTGTEEVSLFPKSGALGDRMGEKNSHVLYSVELTEWKNDFPCSLGISLKGAHEESLRKVVTTSNKLVQAVLLPNTTCIEGATRNTVIYQQNHDSGSLFWTRYKGYNLSNIDDGITTISDGMAVVKEGHPVMEVLQIAASTTGKVKVDPPTKGFYMVHRQAINDCMDMLKKEMSTHLKLLTPSDLKLEFKRSHGSQTDSQGTVDTDWTCESEIFDGAPTEKIRERVLKKNYSVWGTLQFKMKHIHNDGKK